MKLQFTVIALATTMAALTACGGGGDSGSSDPNNGTTSDNTSSYVGAWTTACYSSSKIKDATTAANANTRETITLKRVDNSNMTASQVLTVYASTDATCTGVALGVIERSGLTGSSYSGGAAGVSASNGEIGYHYDSTITIAGKAMGQFTQKYPALTSTLPANTTITAGAGNRFTISLADFQAKTEKNIVYLSGNQFTIGQADLNAYPTALGTTAAFIYTKGGVSTASSVATTP
jgi:hypothetical protein